MRITSRIAAVAAVAAMAFSGSGIAADTAEAGALDFEPNICELAAMVGVSFGDCTTA